ncbi:TlpA family protein disulfide reductase [Metaclostridioides mangenotii]|uniref:Thiol-disulfide isomerase/thioredoxin n=1 Tax=Metaclostridioides mangenotii TaxID=1540 RepID=A0ABS4EBN5_9FIRM|nr:redoxin family protein [Clostridioides mangenotii]MBP1855355.1 thiol-disulfide isomerase/thioredoxin [Clostridioides mangenotii]
MKRKKILTILTSGLLCLSLVACDNGTESDKNQSTSKTKKTKKTENQNENDNVGVRRFEDLGLEVTLPKKLIDKERYIDMYGEVPIENINGQLKISYIPFEIMEKAEKLNKESEKIPETDKAKIEKIAKELMNLTKEFKELCIVANIDKSKTSGKAQKELFSRYENKEIIGKEGNYEFYLLYNNKPNTDGLSDKTKKDYEEICKEIKNFGIKTFKPISEKEKLSKHKKIEFNTKTIDGKKIDSNIFKQNKLTMVNIWATYCGPCIEEMPDIQKLYEEVKDDDVNVIGLISDTPDEDNEELAKQIISKKGVKYTNIIPDKSIENNILKDVSGVPVTVFVDRNGNIVGESLTGAHSKEEYKKEVQSRLDKLK